MYSFQVTLAEMLIEYFQVHLEMSRLAGLGQRES